MVASTLASCGDAGDSGADAEDAQDGGVDAAADTVGDAGDVGEELPPPICSDGLDLNGDGVCDRSVADWSRDARVPAGTTRRDIYDLGDEALGDVVTAGVQHALVWPISVSGVLLPWVPLARMFDPNATDDVTLATQRFARNSLGFGTTTEMYDWLGLARWDGTTPPTSTASWPAGVSPGDALGAGTFAVDGVEVLTFSCATCHTAQLFGHTVYGATNRRAQANEFFHLASDFFPYITPAAFAELAGANEEEVALFVRTQENLPAVAAKMPQVRGLDTSLAQVSLSLARRAEDEWASRDESLEFRPRPNALSTDIADSKPAVWWNLRYKTRWLSDGSIVSGNPIYTNFLWNEIGRATDLQELAAWLAANQQVVDELTVAAFAAESPRWTDFFGTDAIDIPAAQRGQALFDTHCSTCHGTYVKAWETPGVLDTLGDPSSASAAAIEAAIATVELRYHEQTPVFDVGTDSWRARGMNAFADRLNELAISAQMGTVVEVQTGYVPPPLDGIWSRYPYLHNQSVPTLCDLLVPATYRTGEFWMGPDEDPEADFDAACVGLPVGDRVPESWKEEPRNHYDTSLPGLGNFGHDEWLTADDGTPLLSEAERSDLIAFLRTL
ncbi:MAG: hypothetical protein H6700_08135 [Myxococcales bacterium]|nr:hypothetical protein [Myxococcales bacterium]